MELYLLRHGIPLNPEEWRASDRSRPLTEIGRNQVAAVIRALQARRGFAVDAIWSSPYLRAENTAKIAAKVLGSEEPIICPGLASGADLLHSLPEAQRSPSNWPTRLLLVGHQPDLGLLVGHLIGDPSFPYGFGRAGSAKLTGEFAPGGMTLDWLLTAEEAVRG
jgi:phosphohistidine phosphatase